MSHSPNFEAIQHLSCALKSINQEEKRKRTMNGKKQIQGSK